MFREAILPSIRREIGHMKYSLFHLDGPGAPKHLDSLLELDSLDGIQWVYGAGDRPPCAVVNRVGRLLGVFETVSNS